MSKSAVLDPTFIAELGLSEQILTLAGPIQNLHHPETQEPMFAIPLQGGQTVWMERAYVFANQLSLKAAGPGTQLLIWQARSMRPRSSDPGAPMAPVDMARELFQLGEWKDFQRFKAFCKSQRILDAQARQWLAAHHGDLPRLAENAAAVDKVVDILGRIAPWPDLDAHAGTGKGDALELVAKTYNAPLAAFRASGHLCAAMLRRAPDVRFNIFRLMGYVEDPHGGSRAFVAFLSTLASELRDSEAIVLCGQVASARDLAKAFAYLRKALFAYRG
jgi:hypothetical protein